MCNIAGYAGNKPAAPILLEMLRRQEMFDGGCNTGIATIHEGKLYMRKVVGNVDALIRETDALSLPGTIGIAHSRPGGTNIEFAHPFISTDGRSVIVENGTLPKAVGGAEKRDAIADMLDREGHVFTSRTPGMKKGAYPTLQNGDTVHIADMSGALVEHYKGIGLSIPEALARMMADVYADTVAVYLSLDEPDKIFATRNARPMYILSGKGESYIATAPFGFLDEREAIYSVQLPTMKSCEITRGSYSVTSHEVNAEKIAPITPEVYRKAYDRVVELLTGKEDEPLNYDDIELDFYNNCQHIWPEQHTLTQYASIAYETLFTLKREGKLKWTPKLVPNGTKYRLYMHI